MTYRTLFLFVLAVGFAAAQSMAQDKNATDKKAEMKTEPEMDASMKAWMEAAAPGVPHQFLGMSTGTWTTKSKMFMAPDQPPVENEGSAVFSMIMGGRFQQQEFNGVMMGQPFKGLGFMGYDNLEKKYSMVWIDETGTAIYTAEGTADATGKIITMFGTMDDPMTKEMNKKVKYVSTMVDDDTQIFEFYDLGVKGDLNYKAGEIVYKRKK